MHCKRLVAVLLLAAARTALAQDSGALISGDAEANSALLQLIEATRAQGLPVDPILSKVSYAIHMHAPPARILAAARAIAARLPVARDALAPRDTPVDIAAAESALSFAIPRETIAAVRKASPDASIASPLGTLTQLVASGVKVTQASAIVLSLIRRGATSEQLAAFTRDVNSDVSQGGRPDDALSVRMRFLSAALAPSGTPAVTGQALTSTPKPGDPRKPTP